MYRIIYKVCSTESEAKSELKKVKQYAKNPQVVFSTKSNSWVVQLFQCETRYEINQAYAYYRKKGIKMNIQNMGKK